MAKASKKTSSKKKVNRVTENGRVYIAATFNNTLVTITNNKGDTLAWSSAGASGFKGTRKSTPYASQVAAENAMKDASMYGIEKADIYIKGIGVGRDQSLRGIASSGIDVLSVTDITPVAHGGCRKRKVRRP